MAETAVEEGKNNETSGDIDTQITIKQSLIIDVMGKDEGNKLLDSVNKDPKQYVNDSRKMVKELAKLTLTKKSKKMTNNDLYTMIEQLQAELAEMKELQQKSMPRKWTNVGNLNDIEKLVKQYSPLQYQFGIRYNHTLGCVHQLIFNSWNRGIRISTLNSYPMGDNGKTLQFGRTVFTKGLDEAQDKSKWYQHYYLENGDKYYSSNGVVNPVVFVRLM